MTTATLASAHDKKRPLTAADLVSRVRAFAIEMYEAHGGWFVHDAGQPASGALARTAQAGQRRVRGLTSPRV